MSRFTWLAKIFLLSEVNWRENNWVVALAKAGGVRRVVAVATSGVASMPITIVSISARLGQNRPVEKENITRMLRNHEALFWRASGDIAKCHPVGAASTYGAGAPMWLKRNHGNRINRVIACIDARDLPRSLARMSLMVLAASSYEAPVKCRKETLLANNARR